jgi:PAS domain-containing protein
MLTMLLQINEHGIIQKYNESAAQTFGYSKEETIGQNIKMLMPPDVADKHDGYLRRYVETGVAHIIGSKRGVCCVAGIMAGPERTHMDMDLIVIFAEVTAKAKDGRAVVCELKLNEIRVNCTGRYLGVWFERRLKT